jgi:hypothetical protein
MKKRKRLSPFNELVRFIENESFDHALKLQLDEPVNLDFALGYSTALNVVYTQAMAIYKRGLSGREFIELDLGDSEMITKIKKGE